MKTAARCPPVYGLGAMVAIARRQRTRPKSDGSGYRSSNPACRWGFPNPGWQYELPKGNAGIQHEVKTSGRLCRWQVRAISRLNRLFPERTASAGSCARPSEGRPLPEVGPNERIVENFEPPRHAVAALKGHSVIAGARDEILRAVLAERRSCEAPVTLRPTRTGASLLAIRHCLPFTSLTLRPESLFALSAGRATVSKCRAA